MSADLASPRDTTPAYVMARDGALDRVEVVDGSTAPGVWITDRAARTTGLGVGDEATIGAVGVPQRAIGARSSWPLGWTSVFDREWRRDPGLRDGSRA